MNESTSRTSDRAEVGFRVVVVLFVLIGLAAAWASYLDLKHTTDAMCGGVILDGFSCDPATSSSFRAALEGAAPWMVGAAVAGVGRYLALLAPNRR